ncbi:hypothetical protein BGC31_02430 [Komagataeibacter xylinus]|nr:hypothetical protein BGC31_02430 [Komagataeibacter xylinus]
MLPVVGQAQVYEGLQQAIPHALFSPTVKPDIDGVPLAVALMHVPPRATDAQDIKHSVEKQTIISCWPGPAATFRRQQIANNRPFSVRQVATHSLVSIKNSFESHSQQSEKIFCQRDLTEKKTDGTYWRRD